MRIESEPVADRQRAAECRSARSRAFTLIELIVVIIIIAIVAAIAVPKYANAISRYAADAAARRLAADLTLARVSARNGSKSVTLTFGNSTTAYQITGIANLADPTKTYSVDLAADPYRATVTSISFGGATQITFDGFGTPGTGGTVVIQVGSTQRTVTLDAASGAVMVQ